MRRGLLLLSILLMPLLLFAEDGDNKGKIKGAVIEATSDAVVEYATIALYTQESKELLTGTVTDHTGNFKLDEVPFGTYSLTISFIGFYDKTISDLVVNEKNKILNLGNIELKSAAKELGEVEVVAKQAAIEYKIDKKVINVDKQITAEAGTAIDVLENVPSVQVDVDGNVSLRGSSGFMVLIDGKPTILDPSDVLRQIPSSSIENIEIITNPSVKYDPDGATGIINIITKKNPLEGVSGIVNANVGNFDRYGADFQLSYRVNKFNFILGGNHNRRPIPGTMEEERINFDNDTAYYVRAKGDGGRYFVNSNIRGGIEYDLTKNDFFSVSGSIGDWSMNNNTNIRYDEYTEPSSELFSYKSFDETKRGGTFGSVDAIYQHTFKKKKIESEKNEDALNAPSKGAPIKKGFTKAGPLHTLKFEFNYRYRGIDESTVNELRTLDDVLLGGRRNVEVGPSSTFRFNLDYTRPVGEKDKIEAGVRLRSGTSQDKTELWLFDADTEEIEFVDEFSNETEYFRNISSAYALYAGYAGKFGYQVGLRTEYTDRRIETTTDSVQDPYLIDRWDYFPTLHVSYDLNNDQQVMLSYSRRIDRPRSWWLEPFITWQDNYNVRQGNPELLPEYIDSYDASYIKNFGDNFFSFEGYYRVVHNKVERIQSVYEENVFLTRPENVGKDYSLGFEAMLSLGITKWWDMDISGNFFDYRLEGELTYEQGDETVVEPLNRSSRNWNTRFNNTFRLWKDGVLQINSRYNSESITAQGTASGYFTLDAAFKVTTFEKKLSFNLQGRNLLGTSFRERRSEGPAFRSLYVYRPEWPVVTLTVSYKFNNYRVSRKRDASSEDEF